MKTREPVFLQWQADLDEIVLSLPVIISNPNTLAVYWTVKFAAAGREGNYGSPKLCMII